MKEVLLKKVELPEEYAKGLEDLLLKEQEDDRTSVDAEIEQKKVAIAQSQAEAAKVREVKRAEGDAQAQVIMAKAQSDAMQYTLPLKQKQIEQSRLEAEARKQTTIEDAEAAAQAKVIDSKAEQQRQGLMADSEANHIRVTAQADQDRQKLLADSEANRIRVTAEAEQERQKLQADSEANRIRLTAQAEGEEMQLQAAALKVNPLLVQLTVAQRLSDRVQIMMVPNDGKFFFTNDVLKSAMATDSGNLMHPLRETIEIPGRSGIFRVRALNRKEARPTREVGRQNPLRGFVRCVPNGAPAGATSGPLTSQCYDGPRRTRCSIGTSRCGRLAEYFSRSCGVFLPSRFFSALRARLSRKPRACFLTRGVRRCTPSPKKLPRTWALRTRFRST